MKKILLAVLLLNAYSCKKSTERVSSLEAKVLDLGSPSVDGCGWGIRVGDDIYSPINLSENYKEDNKAVLIEFEVLQEKYTCGFQGTNQYTKIKILSIKNG